MLGNISSSFFVNVEPVPNRVSNLFQEFGEDTNASKVNLFIGTYLSEENQPYILPAVRRAEVKIFENITTDHEYLSPCGQNSYTKPAIELLLGKDSIAIKEHRVHGIQSLSGTGALHIGAEFLHAVLGLKTVYISNPTWDKHEGIFRRVGFKDIRSYRYWNSETHSYDFNGMLDDLENAPEGATVVLHACAHNPTGCDPTTDQWTQIANTIERKRLFTFFDSAYQGIATGDLDNDAYAVRYFVSRGLELFCAQSFSKIFGLYGERAGNLIVVHKEPSTVKAVADQIRNIIMETYLTPPEHGARIVETILNDNELYEEWKQNLRVMARRIKTSRKSLYDEFIRLKTPGSWDYIIDQIGMFSYTGLSENQVRHLKGNFHIYTREKRIAMCGLNQSNVAYVAKAIHSAITSIRN
ncbi:aspartate aminotransferase, cytoplasmic-like [Contarinia nasturtii]|uniref:aspartate aminotransferase, cytoplasmic-like n=1 Tax=Contarinia nasturtii TaxID=265458 RepID=UPI0012D3D624|nr:aspartate aminotransferase, cytoplasmic-like [Contarinia nasturtii]